MKQYKPLIFFLLRFLGSYVVMIILYNLYLNQYLPHKIADPFTRMSANLASKVFNIVGFDSISVNLPNENFMRLIVDNKFASIVNEGCNAISVLIIFVAFILAFYTYFKQTFLYIISSLFVLFVMNIFRIVLLTYIFRYHKEYSKMAHDYLFPAIIYGAVIILWIVWIKFFVIKKKQNAE